MEHAKSESLGPSDPVDEGFFYGIRVEDLQCSVDKQGVDRNNGAVFNGFPESLNVINKISQKAVLYEFGVQPPVEIVAGDSFYDATFFVRINPFGNDRVNPEGEVDVVADLDVINDGTDVFRNSVLFQGWVAAQDMGCRLPALEENTFSLEVSLENFMHGVIITLDTSENRNKHNSISPNS